MALNTTVLASSIQDGLQIDGYDKVLKWALRSMPVYRQFVFGVPSDPTNNSRTYHLKKNNFITTGSRALDEVTDPTPLTSPASTDLTITFTEVGALVGRTYRLNSATYVEVDPIIAKQLATDVADTLDNMVRDVMIAGTNRSTSNAGAPETAVAVNTLTAADIFSARLARRAVRDLRKRNVTPLRGENYVAIISPETSVDLREETGASNWNAPHTYVDTSNIYRGEIGTFEGAIYLETNRAYRANDGASSAEVHRTLFVGDESTAEAVKVEPFADISDPQDAMKRHRYVFWRGDLGHVVYRQESLQRVEHGVSA
jgi:N4-gp56 family major capsid protein